MDEWKIEWKKGENLLGYTVWRGRVKGSELLIEPDRVMGGYTLEMCPFRTVQCCACGSAIEVAFPKKMYANFKTVDEAQRFADREIRMLV